MTQSPPPPTPPTPSVQMGMLNCMRPLWASVAGAVQGATWGRREFGIWGALGGAPAGAVVGFVAYFLLVVIVVNAWWIVWGRRNARDDTDTPVR